MVDPLRGIFGVQGVPVRGFIGMVMGQHHHVSPQYLYQFANEAAWKEDHRRLSNGELSYKKLALAMAHPVSRVWAGYWQRAN